MVRDPTHLDVLRLPGAPPRRAGRSWPEGVLVRVAVDDLTDPQRTALERDPRYRVTPAAPASIPLDAPTPPAPRRRR